GVDVDVEETALPGGLARSFARIGEHAVEQLANARDCEARERAGNAAGDTRGLRATDDAGAREHQLAIAEQATVGVTLERVAAPDHARVDAAHDEWRQPAAESVVA